MTHCPEQGFSGVTDEQLARFFEKADQYGIPGLKRQGNSGEASRMGVTIRWSYEPIAQTLSIQCTRAPLFLPCSTINSKVQELMHSVLGSATTMSSTDQT